MVTTQLGTILQELGKSQIIPILDLHPDRNNSCLIRIKGGLEIQLEFDRTGQNLIVGCDLGPIPPGRYRENMFREALKSNGLPHPLYGIFAYSKQTDHLIMYDLINGKDLTGDKVGDFLMKFIDKLIVWRNAIDGSSIPTISSIKSSKLGGLFGLKP